MSQALARKNYPRAIQTEATHTFAINRNLNKFEVQLKKTAVTIFNEQLILAQPLESAFALLKHFPVKVICYK